ncbi:unnamed protein product [Larinioides sclopetarius]|uniref:Uncharacterized protein n=1 Tax=Larinioides sclopetarius TaxID=280406 RepID=A0AAV2A4B1_9ARAC
MVVTVLLSRDEDTQPVIRGFDSLEPESSPYSCRVAAKDVFFQQNLPRNLKLSVLYSKRDRDILSSQTLPTGNAPGVQCSSKWPPREASGVDCECREQHMKGIVF